MSSAQTDAWVADFGIGIGVAAIVAGGVLLVVGRPHEETGPATPTAPSTQASAWGFRVVSGAHGGEAFLTRSF
jgi:hypothetical protein